MTSITYDLKEHRAIEPSPASAVHHYAFEELVQVLRDAGEFRPDEVVRYVTVSNDRINFTMERAPVPAPILVWRKYASDSWFAERQDGYYCVTNPSSLHYTIFWHSRVGGRPLFVGAYSTVDFAKAAAERHLRLGGSRT